MMPKQSALFIVSVLSALAFTPTVLADCQYYSDGSYTCDTFNPAAWFGVAAGILVFILIVGALIRYKRRQRANTANLAYIQNATQAVTNAQWNAQQHAYVPPYAAPGGYDPTNAGAYDPPKGPPHQSSETTGTFPKPEAPQTTGEIPQYPPPTYTGRS